ncbi:MAG TPA: hypothetical protein VLR90_22545 [Blastocatellia bacterium]|nr:hypothetical protein [Blastocatellia bacterium]
MSTEDEISYPFSLPPLKIDRLDVALSEPRYMVTLLGPGERMIISPKLADLITELKQDKPIDEIARDLSEYWGKQVSSDDLRFIVEQQMIPCGLAYTRGKAPATAKIASENVTVTKVSLPRRLIDGRFQWRLMSNKLVGKICSPLAVFYEPFSVILALVLILTSRYLLYRDFDNHFFHQVVGRSTPVEYLVSLALLISVVLFHEFGHAAAQVQFGLRTGQIGFQFYHYIPAFFANVSNSWKLKPGQRIVVDIGGIYFQSIAASILYLIYLKTDYIPLLATVIASDTLCIISINPFLRFDGYWLLTDALAVPNLREFSEKLLGRFTARLFKQPVNNNLPKVSRTRAVILVVYAVVRNCFWLLLTFFIIKQASHIHVAASALLSHFFSLMLKGIEFSDWALFFSSLIRSILSIFLLLTMLSLVVTVARRLVGLARKALAKLAARQATAQAVKSAAQE